MAIKLTKVANDKNLIRNLGKQYKLVTHIDRALAGFDEEFEFRYTTKGTDDAWHPSGDCLPLASELYWKVKDPQASQVGTSLRKAFLLGHFWHQLLQHIVLNKLEFCESEAIERRGSKVWGDIEGLFDEDGRSVAYGKPFHYATGLGDIAPCHIPNYGEYVVDFKTMNNRDFAQNGMPGWCADKYEAQINIYMDFFDLEKALIVPIQKDSPHNMKEFEFVRNQPLIDAIYDKWKFVAECLENNEEPNDLDDEHFNKFPFEGPIE